MTSYHKPVLLSPSVNLLVTDPGGIYVDVTYGGGGHSREILGRLAPSGRLLAFDQDPDSTDNTMIDDKRFRFIPHNFKFLKKFLHYYQASPVNGILADLGVSSYQFDTPERGFSYRYDGKLDMRMNPTRGISAYDILNSYPESKLADIFYTYGELSNAKGIAHKIEEERSGRRIITTSELVALVSPFFPPPKLNKGLSQLFQALRIEVNGELEVLKEFLLQTPEVLMPGGKLVIISYHSLEDRLVKNFMRSGNFTGEVEKDFFGNPQVPFKKSKMIIPNDQEIMSNARARSAKMRVAEKL